MQRRKYLATISATVSGLALAGCSSASEGQKGSKSDCVQSEVSGENVDPVEIRFDGRLDSADIILDIVFDATTTDNITTPEESKKAIYVNLEINNDTGDSVRVTPYMFKGNLETSNTTKQISTTPVAGNVNSLDETNIKPDGKYSSYIYFQVPDNSTSLIIEADSRYTEQKIVFNPNCGSVSV